MTQRLSSNNNCEFLLACTLLSVVLSSCACSPVGLLGKGESVLASSAPLPLTGSGTSVAHSSFTAIQLAALPSVAVARFHGWFLLFEMLTFSMGAMVCWTMSGPRHSAVSRKREIQGICLHHRRPSAPRGQPTLFQSLRSLVSFFMLPSLLRACRQKALSHSQCICRAEMMDF